MLRDTIFFFCNMLIFLEDAIGDFTQEKKNYSGVFDKS